MSEQRVIDTIRLSEMLVVGFIKCWPMWKVASVAGVEFSDDVQGRSDAIHAAAPFMPARGFQYSSPVRAYVAAEWPKLAAFLCRHEKDAEKALSAAPQIRRLTSNGRLGRTISDQDRKEIVSTRKDAHQVATANTAARKQQLSTQRGAWNVCK